MKHISNSVIFDTKWRMMNVKHLSVQSKYQIAVLDEKGDWYFGEGKTITEAMEKCEEDCLRGESKASDRRNISEIF